MGNILGESTGNFNCRWPGIINVVNQGAADDEQNPDGVGLALGEVGALGRLRLRAYESLGAQSQW